MFWRMFFLFYSGFLLAESKQYTLEDCVKIAVNRNADILVAESKVMQFKALLREVESMYYPKLSSLMYLAPMFTVRGSALEADVERKYKDIGDWGPYTHLESRLAMPIYTFGRLKAGEDAAKQRVLVEEARLEEAKNTVALEVKKMFYLLLYAKTMRPSLEQVYAQLEEIQVTAEEMYAAADGKVSKVDLLKLKYASLEIEKFKNLAITGEGLAKLGLKHLMGVQEEVKLKSEQLESFSKPDLDYDKLLLKSKELRPEWRQIEHGLKAASSLQRSESLSYLPVVFTAAVLEYDWTPMRDSSDNPYHYDPYNQFFGGVAIGLKWDLDVKLTQAKVAKAKAISQEVLALEMKAKTGIPAQISKAYRELNSGVNLLKIAKKSMKTTKKWMLFAVSAYKVGTGEVKDILEGMIFHLQAKKAYNEQLRDVYISKAELEYAVGGEL